MFCVRRQTLCAGALCHGDVLPSKRKVHADAVGGVGGGVGACGDNGVVYLMLEI